MLVFINRKIYSICEVVKIENQFAGYYDRKNIVSKSFADLYYKFKRNYHLRER